MPTSTIKGSEGASHRLKDLSVYEVSLVDRPANKRPFLLVKAESEMPKGQELHETEDGRLEKGSFSAGRKKKYKSALSSAIGSLNKLLESIEDAEDEESFAKGVAGVVKTLGTFGGGANNKPKDDEDKSDAKKGAMPDHHSGLLDSLESKLTEAIEAETASATTEKSAGEVAALNAKVDGITKAVHKLADVVKGNDPPNPRRHPLPEAEARPVAKSRSPTPGRSI